MRSLRLLMLSGVELRLCWKSDNGFSMELEYCLVVGLEHRQPIVDAGANEGGEKIQLGECGGISNDITVVAN